MAKSQKMLDKTENVTSTNRGLGTKNHCVVTYEKTKKRLLFLFILNDSWKQMEFILFHCKYDVYKYKVFVEIYTLIYFLNF